MWKPELLAPAKNLERLYVAIAYGADAVYVGGQRYGLRARADNLTDDELMMGVRYAHSQGAKVYVTLNAFFHDDDFADFDDYCQFLEHLGVDAVIVSDLGVIRAIQAASNLEIHLSTQASCLNTYAAQFWKQMGVHRIVVGRELSVEAGGSIQRQAGIDVEMFVHGAMCMAYSGHCTISNFIKGRDSNRGGCVQSCRLPYQVSTEAAMSTAAADFPPRAMPTTLLSSKDLWGIGTISAFFDQRICALKIEGRMKSSFYVATTCKVYRQLIDAQAEGRLTPALYEQAAAELKAAPYRDYATGSLQAPADGATVYHQATPINVGDYEYLGLVIDTQSDVIVMRLATGLNVGDTIELIPVQGPPITWPVSALQTLRGEAVDFMRQDNVVAIPKTHFPEAAAIAPYNVARIAASRSSALVR
ncbi:U32 family peptidase [Lyngbya confervoides]|uniref:U32 family peptidase n=1 Tax=Lyngbya confervoides BDU141951 TaxID=1574623 RepID=A0ABD4T4L9_9CYAN|nr:U32 family peptidase [Lyngbya confervoides]MCM1983290.1 U32 family peptidase [Lyngbya confervoides BDU141951]